MSTAPVLAHFNPYAETVVQTVPPTICRICRHFADRSVNNRAAPACYCIRIVQEGQIEVYDKKEGVPYGTPNVWNGKCDIIP